MIKKQLQVEAIAQGTVIDHIPAGQGVKILKFFQLSTKAQRITVGINLPTHSGGSKDLIKIANTAFDEEQANQLALFAPRATINVIDNFEVVKKFKVATPEAIQGVFTCLNANCISHSEPVLSHFYVRRHLQQIKLRCHYCEKSYAQSLFGEFD